MSEHRHMFLDGARAFSAERYLEDCRRLALAEIRRFVPKDTRRSGGLYEVMLDYPLRPAKALRPALCIATCLALGGHVDAVLPSAAAFELFHNAFLVHDDVEDGSLMRRHGETLHRLYGVPIAVNVGDGMLALSLSPLLDNVRVLGLGPALQILQLFARMARESAEGQMLELTWTRARRWNISDREYLCMVHKKTGWYSFVTPVLVGAIASNASPALHPVLCRFALLLGIAFQIQDDLLSLEAGEDAVGKDGLGDLWEGKYTLALIHALRTASPDERGEALAILAKPRPVAGAASRVNAYEEKTEAEVLHLAGLVRGRRGASLAHARNIARRHVDRAARMLQRELGGMSESIHKQFLSHLVSFVLERGR